MLNVGSFVKDIAHVISISGPVSVKRMIEQSFSGPLKGYRGAIERVEREATAFPAYCEVDGADGIGENTFLLAIHSSDDPMVNVNMHFEYLRSRLGGRENCSFLLVDGKAHNPNYTSGAVKLLHEYLAQLKKLNKKGLLSTDAQKKQFVMSLDWRGMTEQDNAVWDEIFKTLEK